MKNTLFFKMLITTLSVTLTLLILLGVTASTVFIGQHISDKKEEMERECSEISAVVSSKYLNDERRNLALEEFVTIARKYDALIQMHFSDPYLGNISVANITNDNTKWKPMAEYYTYIDEMSPAVGKNVTESDVFSHLTDMHTMTLAVQIRDNETKIGTLCFTVDTTKTFTAISNVIVDMVIIAALAVVLAFFAVLYITERMTRPIAEMTKVVRRFSKGEYHARITSVSDDEVGELAKSFNKMADEVNTLEEARRSFVANVSHELRSPLTSMNGFLVAMQDGTIPPEMYDKYLSIVIDENKRLTVMVNELLDMARIESGDEKLVFEVFDIAETVRKCVITFEARITSKNITLEPNFCEEQVYVSAGKNQIIHVLRNLIDNAIKFTPEGGKITISITESRQKVWVSVKDSGAGISEEDMPHIFDRFYKAEKAHTRTSGTGTGLGLAIVKRIIDAHEQEIFAENDGGARFTFSLKKEQRPRKRH